ncbi:MAG: SDR family oxidoreductase [bacterium]|nr:SDR family oxidoreductase [bacterium]MCP5040078.1 SDR family oxidoreductase [bacterium]
MGRLEGKVALITGAGSGIGLAVAKRYAAEGAVVVGFDLQQAEDWSDVEKAAPGALFRVGDVRDGEAQAALAAEALEQFGRIDTLVTAAGVAGGGPVHLVPEEEWDRVQDINLKGTYLSAKAVLPAMIEQRSGSIITVASVEGLEAQEGGSTYNASKGGVVLLMKNMAIDYGRVGIRVNAICPGFIETPLFESVMAGDAMAEFKEKVRQQHKLGRFGKPEEIAGAAFFLASDDSSFVTGQAIAVDGGFTAGKWFGITKMMGLE